jgi:cytochrome c-type biogenesis protein CcmH/NrfG
MKVFGDTPERVLNDDVARLIARHERRLSEVEGEPWPLPYISKKSAERQAVQSLSRAMEERPKDTRAKRVFALAIVAFSFIGCVAILYGAASWALDELARFAPGVGL